MNKSMLILIFVAIFFGVLFWNFGGRDIQDDLPYYVKSITTRTTTVAIRTNIISAEIAETDSSRYKGLSGRDSVHQDRGMLFVFDEKDIHSITMRDMNIGIDILWIDEGKIVYVVDNAVPPEEGQEPETYTPDIESIYVLEVSENYIETTGAAVGDFVAIGLTQE
ncbi:DUF192 domain-containing protein [Patescibacteria group bacterium]